MKTKNHTDAGSSLISPFASIEDGVSIGAGCTVGAGVHLCNGLTVGNNVRIDANATFARGEELQSTSTKVHDHVFIGANATIAHNVVIEFGAYIKAGAVVTRSVPRSAIVEGNPGSIVGYVDALEQGREVASGAQAKPGVEATAIKGVTIHTFPLIADLRGNLTVGEFEKNIPFIPKRYFMVLDVPNSEIRGEHAHYECHQFLICVRGTCSVVADDGQRKIDIVLSKPNYGVYLPPLTWGVQYKYSSDALLLVFASHHYDADDYIRDYKNFLDVVASNEDVNH